MTPRPTYEELETRIAQLERERVAPEGGHQTVQRDKPVRATAFLSSPDNLVIFRLQDGMILDVNETFLKASGYTREEIVGRTVEDLGLWTTIEDHRHFIRQLRDSGEVSGFLTHFTPKAGESRPFEIAGRHVEIGGEDCAVSIFREPIAPRRQEQALRKQVGTLESVLRAAPTGIGLTRERVIVEANQRLCTMLGHAQEELVGQSARMLYPSEEEFQRVGRVKYGQIARRGTGSVETRWVCKDGRIIDVLLSSAPIVPGDLTQGVTFTALDITNRKQAEHTLERQHAYLAALHETALGLVSHLELNDVLQAIVQNAVALIRGADGFVYIYEPDTDEIVIKAAIGRYAKDLLGFRLKVGEESAGRAALNRQPIIVKDYQNWSGRSHHPIFDNLRAALSVPILSRDKVVGTISMSAFDQDKDFQPEEVDILSRFADLAAIALENARLYSRLQTELRDKHQVEAKLRDSEQRYRSVFENTGTGTVLSEQDTTLSMVNQGFADLVGFKRDEIEGRMKWTERVDPADRERMLEIHYLRRRDPAAAPTSFECGLIDRRGVRRDVMLKVDLIPGTTTSVGSFTDITPLKNAEQNLRKYQQMVTSSSDYMALVGRDYRYQVVNAPYVKAFARPLAEIVGRTVSEVFGEEKFERHQKPKLDRCLAGEDLRFKAWYETPGIGRRYIDTLYYPSRDEDGTISGVVIVGRDITDLRQLEGQLLQAQKMEAVGTLAGGLAHDFNNLLMGIQGRTSLMLSEADRDHPFREHLEGIESHVKSAVDLTRQVLGFARGGKYEVKPTDLNALIETQNHLFSRTRKEITIRSRFAENLWPVEVDRGQIKQVLLNLYLNAWQAMPSGGELLIATENIHLSPNDTDQINVAPGRFVRITVSDNGVGMDAAVRERIFEPFFTTREMGRGTGLGLASVYGILKNHGGFITVESVPGEGSTFHFHLPASTKTIPRDTRTAEQPTQGQGTLLLVDDEQMILDVGAAMLKRLGYEVHLAKGGEAALNIYRERGSAIDLVILDMVMPGMGGGEVFDGLKAINPAVKVILSSGYSLEGQASEIMTRGCAGFIQKPFGLTQLSAKVTATLAS